MAGGKTDVGAQLIDLLKKAKPADVDAIDAEIAKRETALEEIIGKHMTEIKALRRTRKLLAVAAGVEAPRKAPTRKPKPVAAASGAGGPARDPAREQSDAQMYKERRVRVVKLLRESGGSMHFNAIVEKSGIAPFGRGSLGSVLSHEWFHINPEKIVTLTSAGDKATVV